jgi:chromosomal replication initiation ATPase DnaA
VREVAATEKSWEALADEFVIAYDSTHSIPEALKRVFKVARHGHGPVDDYTDGILSDVARRHRISVNDLVFGGREFSAQRFEAFWLLHKRRIGYAATARLFRMNHTSVMHGVAKFEEMLAESAELRAAVAWAPVERAA